MCHSIHGMSPICLISRQLKSLLYCLGDKHIGARSIYLIYGYKKMDTIYDTIHKYGSWHHLTTQTFNFGCVQECT